MNSYAKYIETMIAQEPENKLLEANTLYSKSFGTVPEMHSAAPNGSWCGDQRQLSAANGTLN